MSFASEDLSSNQSAKFKKKIVGQWRSLNSEKDKKNVKIFLKLLQIF